MKNYTLNWLFGVLFDRGFWSMRNVVLCYFLFLQRRQKSFVSGVFVPFFLSGVFVPFVCVGVFCTLCLCQGFLSPLSLSGGFGEL